ncbi:hypothetical protein BDQ17DRAFT_1420409 [Cyathus striatus]|nr:hypothetical protein BDQ17DRAFT_1420409 [Cyathus striatus]
MSDSFADLWNSTIPSKPSSAPQKLGSLASNTTINTNAQRRPQYDAFSLLSSTGTSTQPSRSTTPGITGSVSGRISQTSQSSLGAQLPRSTSTSSSSSQKPTFNGDAFSDLLGTSNKSINDHANMTIAERAKLVERQRLGQQQQKTKGFVDATWKGLDTLVIGGTGMKSNSAEKVEVKPGADWDLLSTTTPTKPIGTTSTLDDDWGLSPEFTGVPSVSNSQPPPKPKPSQLPPQSKTLWDLDEFGTNIVSDVPDSSTALNIDDGFGFTNSRSRTDSPSNDFDFGSREDGLLKDVDDDILGELSAPVGEARIVESHSSQPQQRKSSRVASPPPHIIGQLVEMGFSVQQVKVALATTDTGIDVEAALEVLIASGVADNEDAGSRLDVSREPEARELFRQESERSRGQRREQNRGEGARTERRQDQATPELNLQEQADKLREIGLNMFNKASLFWKEGKERVQRVVEERVGPVGEVGNARGGASSRPRWMQDAVEEGINGREVREIGAFKDDDGDEQVESMRTAVQQDRRRHRPYPQQQHPASSREKVADLFDTSEEPVVYKSKFRHKAPQASTSALSSLIPPATVVTPLKRRDIVSCSPSVLSQSDLHKSAGTEKFKLGQYATAEESYTSAIMCLPPNHLMLVPLYNNRALVRMKNGNYLGAAEDASDVVAIIGEEYHPLREAKVEGRKEDGAGIDLSDGFIKALKRRAEAWEGRERWSEAGKDWERLAGMDWVKQSVKTEAVRGAGRCRRMVDAADKPVVSASTKPKPRPAPRPLPQPQGTSKAVSALRETTSMAEAEDAAKHQLKDSVDTRLQTWKGGKETNLRALLSSLDTILWSELGLQKISLAELMSAGQVKKWYMKAIAKVHPDKLNASNSTLEQRMLAGGVFTALNEAWIAFKP